jgi:hypothetical protein
MSSSASLFVVFVALLVSLATFTSGQSLRSTSECAVSPCIPASRSTNTSCSMNPSVRCYAYEVSSTNQLFCAPSVSCSSLEPCIDNLRCTSNSSVCLLSTCCSRPLCMPRVLAAVDCSDSEFECPSDKFLSHAKP